MNKNTASPNETEQLVVTIKAGSHEIVKVEKVDQAGERQELLEQECAKLAGEDELEEIEIALEAAFEAGVTSVLDEDEQEDDEAEEDDEERTLRQLLMADILGHKGRSVVNQLRGWFIRRLVLRRLLRRRVLQLLNGEKEKSKTPKYS